MKQKTIKHGYKVAGCLVNLVNHDVLPGINITADHFWDSVAEILADFLFTPEKLN